MLKRSFDPVAELASVVSEERERIARLWRKRLQTELHEVDARARDLRRPLAEIVSELARLLTDRGEDAVRLWPEAVRSLGVARYDLRYEPEDLARELKALQQVILRVYARHHGTVQPEVADLLTDLIGEATAAVFASYTRVLRTEEVRMRETAIMESLLQHIDVGIVLAEEDGRVSYVTPPISRLLGLPARVLMGADHEALRAILTQLHARHCDDGRYRVQELPFMRALKEKRQIRDTMVIDRLSDGREVVIEMNALPVRQEGSDALYGVVMTVVDRTETTQRARELREAYEQLRTLQNRLLERSRAQALGQLASGAAHNLNNFLNVLRLRLTLLRREYKPEYLDALDRTISNISELVARLQDFATPRMEEELVDTSFNSVVLEALDLVRPQLQAQEEPIRLDVSLEGEPLSRFDPVVLRELLVNLVLNARSRMPDGGELEVRSKVADGWIELTIRDQGPPYTQDEIVRLFDPLKGKTPAPQLSLLLAVGRNQVQHWGGELWVENLPDGKGAAYRLRLPEVQPAARAEERQTVEEERAARPKVEARRVLVVDDEPENARMMAQVLTEEGYDVRVATSGDDALALWQSSQFDAALLDALLPDRSGWAIAREIRARNPNALLAVVTGADVRGQNRDNLALVDAVFHKPIDVGELDDFLSQSKHLRDEEEEGEPLH